MEWRSVWRILFPKRMIAPDVSDEISFHIEGRVRELVDAGWDEDEARTHVMERFGDVETVERACREADAQRVERESWRLTMEGWMRDLRLALRSMGRAPSFTAIVVLTLALGVGASTAVFSVVEGVLLRPLPFPDPDRLAVVWQNDRATGTVREDAAPADYFDYVDRSRAFASLGMAASGEAVLVRPGTEPMRLTTAAVTANFADVLGLSMQVGRSFTTEEDVPGAAGVVLLDDGMWREAFGADEGVLGASLTIDGEPHVVVGVLPPGIDFPSADTDVWVPIRQSPGTSTRQSHFVTVIGRLTHDATVSDAQLEMTRIMSELEAEYPEANMNRGAFVERLSDVGRTDVRRTLWVLFAAVLAVLAIACVNVANLLLARGAARARETAVLAAVGAGRAQVLRRFAAEGAIVSMFAAVGGVLLAAVGVRGLLAMAPGELLALGEPGLNLPVLLFAMACSVLVGMGFALLPALQIRRLELSNQLREGRSEQGSVRMPIRRMLVAAQLGLAVVLVVSATLLVGTLENLQRVDPGFRAENLLRVDFTLPASRVPSMATYPDWPEVHGFIRSLLAEVEALPGARTAAVVSNHPLDRGWTNSFRIEGQEYDPDQGEMSTRMVTPDYFEMAGVQLVEGRFFERSDDVETEGVILLNREAVRRHFPDGNALGSRIGFWGQFRTVVGIVENERIHGLAAPAPPTMYVTMLQSPPRAGRLTLMVRTEVAPLSLVESVRRAMMTVDPEVPVYNADTMAATLRAAASREQFASLILGVFAAVAVFLAMLGVHGVLAYLVAQRGREVGVRMALGATRADVVRMIVRQGALMTALGLALGVSGAVAVSGIIDGLLFGVDAVNPAAYAGVSLTLAVVALAAMVLPARRAAAIDPAVSLRGE